MKNLSSIQNIVPKQLEQLKKLSEKIVELSFEWNEARGTASFIRGPLSRTGPKSWEPSTNLKKYKGSALEKAVIAFLPEYKDLFLPAGTGFTYKLNRIQKDDIDFLHAEFDLFITRSSAKAGAGGIPVYGSKLVIHFNADGGIVEVQSSCYRDIEVSNTARIKNTDLRKILLAPIKDLNGFKEFERVMGKGEKNFPVLGKPYLALYPWKEKFLFTWIAYGYGLTDYHFHGHSEEQGDDSQSKKAVDNGMAVIDAATGEILYFASDRKGAEINATGTGLGVVPLGSPASKNLNIVQDNVSLIYRLKNKLNARDVLTYDANDNSTYMAGLVFIFFIDTVGDGIDSGGLLISEDNDANWNLLPADTMDTQRTLGQQPETDAHFFCTELYEWYDALAGGRAGWDNNQFTAPLVPAQPVNVAVHLRDAGLGTPRQINAFFNRKLIGGKWVSYLAFWDGNPAATPPYDYLAGSKFIVGHEYQHAITDFNFKDAMGNPGLTAASGGWLSAVHEGVSDVFGGLFSEQWWPATDISSTGTIFRNLAFPRDTAAFDVDNLDHFDDRAGAANHYSRGTIIAHSAYLIGQGGVHQRSSRTPVLIPVYSLGKETYNGKEVLKAARIWYRAIAYYFSTHGALTTVPNDDSDETVFRTIRDGCVSAAIDIYGAGSNEHKTTALAFYSIGLHPAGTNYGPDVTFLRWGASWWMSRPYIGISSPDWSSVDLFINNAGTSEWNAIINILDGMGNPTEYENNVYCRVRNVGDQPANDVTVTFEYAKAGTGSVTWNTMLDFAGNPATLTIGTLAAGASNFPDADQNTPPAAARVNWYIAPLAAGEVVNHFCIRAHVTSSNDVNTYNNDVQSNVGYLAYVEGMMAMGFGFMAGNPSQKREVPLELKIVDTLPEKWKVELKENIKNIKLKPREEKQLTLLIDMPAGEHKYINPPYDGEVKGEIYGTVCGPVTGLLTNVKAKGRYLEGIITLQVEEIGVVSGKFYGKIDPRNGKLSGKIKGQYTDDEKCGCKFRSIGFRGCLRPHRKINISQFINGEEIGGITVQVQVPLPEGSCFGKAPATDVFYSDKLFRKQPADTIKESLLKDRIQDMLTINEPGATVEIKKVTLDINLK